MIEKTTNHQLGALIGANRCDHYYELHFATGEVGRFYILADGIFRFLLDPEENFVTTQSDLVHLENFDQSAFEHSRVRATNDSLIIQSNNYQIIFNQEPVLMSIFDESLHRTRLMQCQPLELGPQMTSEFLTQNKNEFYFGGGLQNGSFSHKGHRLEIKLDQITGAGGVLMQVPFFWSNAGYGELRNTRHRGSYDFGQTQSQVTTISHQDCVFDTFYLIGENPAAILAKYYSLTGAPAMLPKYAFGLGHIGNYITTLWQPSEAKERNASRFGNNYYTRTSEPAAASGRASLNGEEDYQFSARGLLDRYHAMQFALDWMIPNYRVAANNEQGVDFFNEYALEQEVQPGFWHDQETALPAKTTLTLASGELPLTQDAQQLKNNLQRQRPLILREGGQAGMQKQAALIFSDLGGNWENIATQVAGMLGANLSGQPLVGAAVDGGPGGGNAQIYVRDFEWKAFTPLLFNLDDQGQFSKTPFAYNRKITEINRAYYHLHQHLRSYLYTLNAQAEQGQPIMRPFFLVFPDERINYTEQFSSEFMLGANLLIAPITNGREDDHSETRKDNLYLPGKQTMWIDLFTGQKYAGGRVYNQLSFPLWHLPVFVRGGSIFDFGQRDFVFYPHGQSETVIYDDNGLTDSPHHHWQTRLKSIVDNEKLTIQIDPVKGEYAATTNEQATNLTIMCDSYPEQVIVKINDKVIPVQVCTSWETFNQTREGIFYNAHYGLPAFAAYQRQDQKQAALQIKLAKREITNTKIEILVHNFTYSEQVMMHAITSSLLTSPKLPVIDSSKITAHSFELAWARPGQVQVEINHVIYEGLTGKSFTFHELTPNTRYIIRMRYVVGSKVSEWSDLFGVITKHAALDYAIRGIDVTSNLPAAENYPLAYLTDLKLASEWQTAQALTAETPLVLTFTFKTIENLSRMVYVPRNIDHYSDPLDVSVAVASDGEHYTSYAEHLHWKADSKNKVIGLRNVHAKSVQLTIFQSSGPLVAAREIFFYRAKK